MASDAEFVQFVVDQLAGLHGRVSHRKMFGEYAVYLDGKVVALICDNRLLFKPTEAGRSFIGDDLVEEPPYPGAKNSFLIGEKIDDADWLVELMKLTAAELPPPKPKKKKKK